MEKVLFIIVAIFVSKTIFGQSLVLRPEYRTAKATVKNNSNFQDKLLGSMGLGFLTPSHSSSVALSPVPSNSGPVAIFSVPVMAPGATTAQMMNLVSTLSPLPKKEREQLLSKAEATPLVFRTKERVKEVRKMLVRANVIKKLRAIKKSLRSVGSAKELINKKTVVSRRPASLLKKRMKKALRKSRKKDLSFHEPSRYRAQLDDLDQEDLDVRISEEYFDEHAPL